MSSGTPPSVLIPAEFLRGDMQGGEHLLCVQWVQYRKGAQMSGSPHPLLATGRRPTCFFSTERCTQAVTFGEITQSKEAGCLLRRPPPVAISECWGSGLPSVSGAFLEGRAECSGYWTHRDCVCSLSVQPAVYTEPSALF